MRGKRGARDLGAVSWLADSPLREKVRAVVAGEETSVEAVDSTVAKCQAARKALQLKKDQDDYAVLKQLYYRRSKLRKAQKKLREEAQRVGAYDGCEVITPICSTLGELFDSILSGREKGSIAALVTTRLRGDERLVCLASQE